MKLASRFALISCIAMAIPLGAQAAMDDATRKSFNEQCISTAKQQNLNEQAAKAHCDCGARQVDSLTPKEIASLNDAKAPQDARLTQKLQDLVARNCGPQKN